MVCMSWDSLDRREDREMIVEKLLQDYSFVTMRNNEIYVYQNGVYNRDIAESLIKQFVEEVMGEAGTRYDKNEVIDRIRCRTYENWSFWNQPKNLICVANGVLNVDTLTLEPHSPEHHFLTKIPVWYIPQDEFEKLNCESRIDKFFREVLPSEEDVKAMYEFFGYCLYRSMSIHKAFMLVGVGANGKSTLLSLLKAFLGKESIANISLQQLCQNRFAMAELHGKLANIFADLTRKSLDETGMFKMLTGNDTVDAERKFVQKRVKLTNYAKLIFSCNMIPANEKDDTKAFWRRWILITFPNIFDKEHGNVDEKILEKLIIKEELSDLLLKSLEGLKRLLENGKFSNYKKVEDIRQDYIMKSNPVHAFVEKQLIVDVENFEQKSVVYRAYKEFCKEHSLPILDNNIFSRKLRTYIQFRDCQKTISGKKGIWCYHGIRLLDKFESESKQQKLPNR